MKNSEAKSEWHVNKDKKKKTEISEKYFQRSSAVLHCKYVHLFNYRTHLIDGRNREMKNFKAMSSYA